MNKLKCFAFILLCFFLQTSASKAQYSLQPAFPDIPTFSLTTELVHAGDGTNRLFITQQRGIIYVINNSSMVNTRKIFMNLSKVSQSGGDHGLLGLAFHPGFDSNHYFYINYTFDSISATSRYWSRISRFRADSVNNDTAFNDSEEILIAIPQLNPNHKGGTIAFGPEGYLYISFGDGGIGGAPESNGQNLGTMLAKILRINVDSAAGGKKYSIPSSNPFFGNTQGYKEEIYAYGLRNVWKFSFDTTEHRLWAGDVGQLAYEEIDIIENGKNYGWSKMEGLHCYPATICDTTGMNFTRPVLEYSHDSGSAVTGGYVYRGTLHPELYGKYIFADYITGKIWAMIYDGINPTTYQQIFDAPFYISSLGIDQNNELYVCGFSSAQKIYKIVNLNTITVDIKLSIEGFYNTASNQLSIKDTVKCYLHSYTFPDSLIDSAKIVIDSVNFNGLCFFKNAPSGSYYVRVKHRNSLETWSSITGKALTRGSVESYDFTVDSTQAFGKNMTLKGNKYCIYSGDVNQDGIIDGSDLSLIDYDASHSVSGYVKTDINGDNFVDASDLSIVDNNVFNGVIVARP